MEKMVLPSRTVETPIGERRKTRRYRLLTRVDILAAGTSDVYWGSLRNLNWTGVALCAKQFLKPGRRVTTRFRFQDEEGCEATEALTARVIWRNGDDMGLEFEPPLVTGSTALRQAPFLVTHLMMKEA